MSTQTYPEFKRAEIVASITNNVEQEHDSKNQIVGRYGCPSTELAFVWDIEPSREEKNSGHTVEDNLQDQNNQIASSQRLFLVSISELEKLVSFSVAIAT